MQCENTGRSMYLQRDPSDPAPARLAEEHRVALTRAVQREGWTLVYTDEPSLHPEAIGSRQSDPAATVQALSGNRLAIREGTERDSYYAAAHEIAEARNGFSGHHQQCWREQCTILARWVRLLLDDAP